MDKYKSILKVVLKESGNQKSLITALFQSIREIELSRELGYHECVSEYDRGYLDGDHDTMVDMLEALGAKHKFKRYDVDND